jgi:hypothetical protein
LLDTFGREEEQWQFFFEGVLEKIYKSARF